MLAALAALTLFVVWSLVGLAALVVLRADVTALRIALTAPAVGSALTVLPLFTLSNAGISMEAGGLPVGAVLVAGALIMLAVRRPHVPLAVAPVLALSVVDIALVGRPMFEFGFDWIANANGDMAYYVLAATNLMEHGLQSPIDVAALEQNRDLATSAQQLHLAGLRPGTQIVLAGLAASSGQAPLGLYMPMALAINM